MTNRLVSNVIIIDSAMGGAPLFGAGTAWLNPAKVKAFALWSIDTTGVVKFTHTDTTNVLLTLTNPNNNPSTIGTLVNDVFFSDIRVPTLTAGTAWIYLS